MVDNLKLEKEKEWDKAEIKSLMVIVLDNIRKRILTGSFRPGQKINESEIALKLDISRSPVREAFRILEREGLIMTLPRKGSYITDISPQDLKELFEIRELLECHAIDGVKKRALKSSDEIVAIVEKIGRELLKGYDALHVISGFHYDLVELSNNFRLIELYKMVAVSLRRYQAIYHTESGQRNISLEQHLDIFNFLKRGDYLQTKRLLKRHIRYVRNIAERHVCKILSM